MKSSQSLFTITSLLPTSIALALGILGSYPQIAQAEGSRELVKNGGHRPYTEWRTGSTGGLLRRTLLKVYANSGEVINVGSSGVWVGNGNALIFAPGDNVDTATPLVDCVAQGTTLGNTNIGRLTTRAQELAGPAPAIGGYTPCTLNVTTTGIYQVVFYGPDGKNGNSDPANTPANATISINTPLITKDQKSTVSLWDITVRNSTSSTTDINGRVFTDYLALIMGNASRYIKSEVYIVTTDGYRYLTDFHGIDPYGFIYLANSKGILRPDGTSLYGTAPLPLQGGVTLQNPEYPIFFNSSANEVVGYLGIPLMATAPAPAQNFLFTGGTGNSGNQTPQGVGGYFSFDAPQAGSYRIIIDTNHNGNYSLVEGDRLLIGTAQAGFNTVFWDGKNENGTIVPGTQNYNAKITLLNGEYHFPLLDVETATSGFSIKMLNPPSSFTNSATASTFYYNEKDYTIGSTKITVGCQGKSPSPILDSLTVPCDALDGVESASGAHKFTTNYGDNKILDTWIYFPSSAIKTSLVITTNKQANVRGKKSVQFLTDTDSNGLVTVGDKVKYTITYSNLGNTINNSDATDFTINDTLPSQLTFESANITTQTSGNTITLNSSYNGSGILTQIGTLRVNDTITIEIIASINNNNSGNEIFNQANATFKTPDSSSTMGNVYTDADSASATGNPPLVGAYFRQTDDDGKNVGNNPVNTADDDPTAIVVDTAVTTPNILLVKRITSINGDKIQRPNGDDMNIYNDQTDYPYDDNTLDSPAPTPPDTDKWPDPSSFLIGAINAGEIEPGDVVEYTIYFLSAGSAEAKNTLLCDRLPNGMKFEYNGYQTDKGILLKYNGTETKLTNIGGDDQGRYFPPTVEPSNVYPGIKCDGPNTNGAIVVELGNLPPATVNSENKNNEPRSYGYVSFRAKLTE